MSESNPVELGPKTPKCSFCGKPGKLVRSLVRSPDGFSHICDECSGVSRDIITKTIECPEYQTKLAVHAEMLRESGIQLADLRSENARLRAEGTESMSMPDPRAELVPRDVVDRLLASHEAQGKELADLRAENARNEIAAALSPDPEKAQPKGTE